VIQGQVNAIGQPVIVLPVAGQDWEALIDTGFNGALQLPQALFSHLNPLYLGQVRSFLAGGQTVYEHEFLVVFPFDGRLIPVEVTFVPDPQILLGTELLREYRLKIDFPARTVLLERAP
jgi:predicted aspartyl protease